MDPDLFPILSSPAFNLSPPPSIEMDPDLFPIPSSPDFNLSPLPSIEMDPDLFPIASSSAINLSPLPSIEMDPDLFPILSSPDFNLPPLPSIEMDPDLFPILSSPDFNLSPLPSIEMDPDLFPILSSPDFNLSPLPSIEMDPDLFPIASSSAFNLSPLPSIEMDPDLFPIASSSAFNLSPLPSIEMDPDLFPIASSSSELPLMTKVAIECDHALWSLVREKYAEALQILESTLSRHSASPLIDATRSLVYYKMASRIHGSTSTRLEHLVKALESSRQAAALAPTSTFCALFHAQVLLRLGKQEAALQECERGVKIERPEEPGTTRRMPTERELMIRWKLWELKEKSNLKIIVLESRKGRDKWKRLLDDNFLVEVKHEIKTLHQMKKRAVAAWSEDFLKEKKVEIEERWKKIWEVKPFWTGMRLARKKALLKIGIQELKEHFVKNNMAKVDSFFQEAIDFAKKAKSWRFWKCFYCGDRFLTDESIDLHIIQAHVGTISSHLRPMIPYKAGEMFIKRVEDGVWKPVESSWAFNIEVDSDILLHYGSWRFCDDGNREGLIKEIRAKLLFFIRSGCFVFNHFLKLELLIKDMLRNHILEQKKVDKMFTMNELRSVCFLEVPDLKCVLACLEDLASAIELPCIVETLSDDQDFYRDVRDRVILNTEFSDILVDEWVLLGESSGLKDDANAVGDFGPGLTHLDPKDDAFLYWLWERDPPIPERLQTWASVRKAGRSQGLKLFKIFEAEVHRQKKLYEMKLQFSTYEKAFEEVEKMYLKVRNIRLEGLPRSYLGMLVKRWSDIEVDGEAVKDIKSLELDVIWSILKVAQEDTEIETELKRQRQCLDHKLLLLDALISATDIALTRTCEALKKSWGYDYRFIVVPMLRSFVQRRLEGLVEEHEHLRRGKSLRLT